MPLKRDLKTEKTSTAYPIPNSLSIEEDNIHQEVNIGTAIPSNGPDEAELRVRENLGSTVNGQNRDHKWRFKAESLKFNVENGPDWRLSASLANKSNSHHAQLDARQSKSAGADLVQPSHLKHRPVSTFDETESIVFDDNSLDAHEQSTVVLRSSNDKPTSYYTDRQQNKPKGSNVKSLEPYRDLLPPNWKEQVEEERWLHQESKPRTQLLTALTSDQNDNVTQREHTDQTQWKGIEQPSQSTPSRSRALPFLSGWPGPPPTKSVAFTGQSPVSVSRGLAGSPDSEVTDQHTPQKQLAEPSTVTPKDTWHQRTINKKTSTKAQATETVPGQGQSLLQKDSHWNTPTTSGFESSRTSDYPTSSEDEEKLRQPKHSTTQDTIKKPQSRKRPLDDDIDYDIVTLKRMTFDQLHNEAFTSNLHGISRKHGLESQVPPRGLADLNDMHEEDQVLFFRSQNDEELSQTGSWFIDRFQENLKRLMTIRLERRKISMRYENQIRQRQSEVESCVSGVEYELKGLKQGGGKLIEGRTRIGTKLTTSED